MAHTPSQDDALFQQLLPLADSIARGFAGSSESFIEFEDARQVAQRQLWLSCLQVDEATTAPAYLRRCIHGALLHHLRNHGRLVRTSRGEHEKGTHPWRHQSLDATLPGNSCSAIDLIEVPDSAPDATRPSRVQGDARSAPRQPGRRHPAAHPPGAPPPPSGGQAGHQPDERRPPPEGRPEGR